MHVAFSPSATGSLRQALTKLRRDEEVLGLADDLSIGPINTADINARMRWSEHELRFHNAPETRRNIETFWKRITAHPNEIIAWMSTRCATEYCGLLELLWRVKVPVSVIDVASTKIVDRDGSRIAIASMSFGYVNPNHVSPSKLIDHAIEVTPAARASYRATWRQLRDENAPVRVLTRQGPASAPIDYFDATLRSFVTTRWNRVGWVVASALVRSDSGRFHQCSSDGLLLGRLLQMIDDGDVETKTTGEETSIWQTFVRRPPAKRGRARPKLRKRSRPVPQP